MPIIRDGPKGGQRKVTGRSGVPFLIVAKKRVWSAVGSDGIVKVPFVEENGLGASIEGILALYDGGSTISRGLRRIPV